MPNSTKADFCIEIDFEKGTENPSRIFRAMTELIETFQALDVDLVSSIDSKIEPVAIIEDIEAGSLRAWLAYILRETDDDALKKMDWKPAVGKYLVKAKYIILNFIQGKTEITDRLQIEQLEKQLLDSAKETDVIQIPSYTPVQRQKLLPDLNRLNASLSHLTEKDKAIYIGGNEPIQINAQFKVVPETLEQLLTRETLTSTSEMILKVKKPDYLGQSQWELRHGSRAIDAKILDSEWLSEFQSRQVDVRPGDSLRADVQTVVRYGFDNEVVGMHFNIISVKEVLRASPEAQLGLLLPEKDEQ